MVLSHLIKSSSWQSSNLVRKNLKLNWSKIILINSFLNDKFLPMGQIRRVEENKANFIWQPARLYNDIFHLHHVLCLFQLSQFIFPFFFHTKFYSLLLIHIFKSLSKYKIIFLLPFSHQTIYIYIFSSFGSINIPKKY